MLSNYLTRTTFNSPCVHLIFVQFLTLLAPDMHEHVNVHACMIISWAINWQTCLTAQILRHTSNWILNSNLNNIYLLHISILIKLLYCPCQWPWFNTEVESCLQHTSAWFNARRTELTISKRRKNTFRSERHKGAQRSAMMFATCVSKTLPASLAQKYRAHACDSDALRSP